MSRPNQFVSRFRERRRHDKASGGSVLMSPFCKSKLNIETRKDLVELDVEVLRRDDPLFSADVVRNIEYFQLRLIPGGSDSVKDLWSRGNGRLMARTDYLRCFLVLRRFNSAVDPT